ncbi:matrix metalloproteinase-1 [Plakobranchus ocellatus]|uniref:Matrix metalloproteinase-1 n=1 Tax=Plakobranchus ocellatus TaxID=259542 RepID=A0AAV4AZ46_9GAST|nr:matrix metalloproteinase-1 [Plakobranchus ocellatus]
MKQDSTSKLKLCLLCRSILEQSSEVNNQPCPCLSTLEGKHYGIYSSSVETPTRMFRFRPEDSLAQQRRTITISTSKSHTPKTCSTILWVCAFTAVLAVSSAASLVSRNGHLGRPVTGNGKYIGAGNNEKDRQDVDEYLEKFGYYRHYHQQWSNPDLVNAETTSLQTPLSADMPPLHTEAEREEAVRLLQNFFHLRPSGHVDMETKEIISAKRCGVEDIADDDEVWGGKSENFGEGEGVIPQKNERHRRKRYAVGKYRDGSLQKWRLDRLTWRIDQPSSQLPEDVQRKTFQDAISTWEQVIPIKFEEETGAEEADIRVLFARREHGPKNDPVFDGKKSSNNTLAHAWGPSSRTKGLSGDVHFDEEDDWSDATELFIVAVHELGHSMGLKHSNDRSSIMYPIYQDVTKLSQDDLDGVDYMYGPNSDQAWRRSTKKPKKKSGFEEGRHGTVKPQWVTRPPPPSVDTCSHITLNAIFLDPAYVSRDIFIVVSGDHVHRLTQRGNVIQSEPLQDVFPDLPENPEIAVPLFSKQTTYFIKGESIWAYKDGALLKNFPRPTQEMGFPEKPLFSLSLEDPEGNVRPFLFGKNYWWLFDEYGQTSSYLPLAEFSRDLPNDVMFATQWSDKRLYAVSDDSYVILDGRNRLATHDKPIAGKPDWLRQLCMGTTITEVQAQKEADFHGWILVIPIVIVCCFLGVLVFLFGKYKERRI